MSKRKSSVVTTGENFNKDICDALLELSSYEQTVSKNIYKSTAYRNAANSLAALDHRIESGAQAKKLKGVGEKIAKKIDEILETGKLGKLDEIHHDEKGQAILLLAKVSGIGPKKASELVEKGITTIEQLRESDEELTHHQQIGLKYFEDFDKKVPRAEIVEIEKIIKTQIHGLDKKFKVTICGSYRRGLAESGDIDVLVSHPDFESTTDKQVGHDKLASVIKCLHECHLITDTISQGDVKFMGVCNLAKVSAAAAKKAKADKAISDDSFRRLDVRIFPHDQYYCSVLYFTGSNLFNQTMRQHARDNNFMLNEYNLRLIGSTGVVGEAVPITSEKEIFEYIKYPYKAPEERDM